MRTKLTAFFRRTFQSSIKIYALIFALSFIAVIWLTAYFYGYDRAFFQNVLVEAHGMLFDVLVLGLLFVWLNTKGEKQRLIKRYQEEIDDYRGWDEKEAMFRIVGNIRRLNKLGISNIDLMWANLSNANLEAVDLQNAHLELARLKNANFEGANLSGAKLSNANLKRAFLYFADMSSVELREASLRGADLTGANLSGADLTGVKDISIGQLSMAKTLYNVKGLSQNIIAEIREVYPHLLVATRD